MVNFLCQRLFLLIAVTEILAYTKQALHQEAAFHQVAAIVLLSERLHLSGRTVQPVGPYAVEAVGTFQIIGNLGQALHTFGSGDKATLYAHQQTGNTESAATDGDDALVFLRIVPVQVNAFGRQSGNWLRTVPHVVQMYLLDIVQHFVIRSECFGTYFLCIGLFFISVFFPAFL